MMGSKQQQPGVQANCCDVTPLQKLRHCQSNNQRRYLLQL